MNKIQIESWAMQIIERVEKNQPNEDSFVELKREWIDPVPTHSDAVKVLQKFLIDPE